MNRSRMILTSVLLTMLVGLVGCSSNGTDPVAKTAGDTTATEYKAAEQVFSDANELGSDGIGEALDMVSEVVGSQAQAPLGRIDIRSASAVAADTLEYHFDSDYWYRVHSQVDTEYVDGSDAIKSIIAWYVRDSLQFRHGNDAVAVPDSALLTELRFGRVAEGWNQVDADSLSIHQEANIVGEAGEIAGLGDVVINSGAALNGSANRHVENLETNYECSFAFDLDGSWNNVALNMFNVIELGDCPSSGSIRMSGGLNAGCFSEADSVQFNGQWSASLTYNMGTQTAVFENATTRWTETSECGLTQPLSVRIR
ncbi:MAG: hypothetical protein IPH75_09985 [bacterium]|nr:hypothetical protein [bacterium]